MTAAVRISVEHVTKRFGAGAVTVFEGLDLAVRDGETLCILGPSGCGKTTLLRCMHGLAEIDEGRIAIDGAEVHAPSRKVAMVFQHFGLMPWKRCPNWRCNAGAPRRWQVMSSQTFTMHLAGFAR